jgi:hypothetical protein
MGDSRVAQCMWILPLWIVLGDGPPTSLPHVVVVTFQLFQEQPNHLVSTPWPRCMCDLHICIAFVGTRIALIPKLARVTFHVRCRYTPGLWIEIVLGLIVDAFT